MYQHTLQFHSILRWLLVASLLAGLLTSVHGVVSGRSFLIRDNAIRHWTATIAHIQLVVGILLYSQSPVIKYFWNNNTISTAQPESLFFAVIHLLLMVLAIVVITIGSALAKRRLTDPEKFRTMLVWFGIALVIIIVAIPWPFSPLAQRPYLR